MIVRYIFLNSIYSIFVSLVLFGNLKSTNLKYTNIILSFVIIKDKNNKYNDYRLSIIVT